MRDPRDDEELEEQILDLREPRRVVAHLRDLIARDALPADTSPAGTLVTIGEYLDMSGDHAEAGRAYEAAVTDGGEVHPDARCYLAAWHFEHGDVAMAERLVDELWRVRPRDVDICSFVGEIFEDRGDLTRALRWLNVGAMHVLRDDTATSRRVQFALMGRRRVRLAQGFVEDDLDEYAVELRDEMLNELDDEFEHDA